MAVLCVRSRISGPDLYAFFLYILLPIVVHPSVDRVFSNYVKCTCAVREDCADLKAVYVQSKT